MKKRKQRKKKSKKDEILTGIFWLDCLIVGGVVVGILNYKSLFGIE